MFTHPPRGDYNKATPQNLHRAKRARTLHGLGSAAQTGNVALLMEQADAEPKRLRLIVSANCCGLTDGRTLWRSVAHTTVAIKDGAVQ